MMIQESVALAPLTTFGIGGPARWFVEVAGEGELVEALRWAKDRSVPIFILGGGSNLLVADAGFDGLVVRVALKGIEIAQNADARLFRVAAGEDWDAFVSLAVDHNCAGIECLAGIPGTVGGTPVQNVGAYGQEVAETIQTVRVLELATFEFREISAAECGFAYRTSIFNSTAKGEYVVTRVDFRLRPGAAANLRYADLQRAFPPGAQPKLTEVTAEVRRIRQAKGMLLVEGDTNCRSAGSFFKNPIVPQEQIDAMTTRLGVRPPTYPAGKGMAKLPAAWLIEDAGFPKGFQLGRAGISSKHTLALVNLGGATAANLLALRDLIRARVVERFGISLEMEPILLGNF